MCNFVGELILHVSHFDQFFLCFLVSAKMPGLSYIVTKQEDPIGVINTVNVRNEIREVKGMLYFMVFLIILMLLFGK